MAPTPVPTPTGGLPATSKEELLARVRSEQAAKAQGKQQSLVWLPGMGGTRKTRGNPDARDLGGDFFEHGRTGGYEPFKDPDTTPIMESVQAWVFDPKKRVDIISKLQKLGYEITDPDDVDKLWFQAVADASFAYMNSGQKQKISPWDILSMRQPEYEKSKTPLKGWAFDSTSTDIDMAEMPPEMVRQGITETLQQILGRGPTEAEINDFAARAASIAAENPYTRTTVNRMEWDPQLEQYVNTGSTTSESGVSQEELNAQTADMAREEASGTSEAQEFGRARAINILMDMLGGS